MTAKHIINSMYEGDPSEFHRINTMFQRWLLELGRSVDLRSLTAQMASENYGTAGIEHSDVNVGVAGMQHDYVSAVNDPRLLQMIQYVNSNTKVIGTEAQGTRLVDTDIIGAFKMARETPPAWSLMSVRGNPGEKHLIAVDPTLVHFLQQCKWSVELPGVGSQR